MPRSSSRRRAIALRASDAGVTWIDERAQLEGLTKNDGTANVSALLRLVVAYAQQNMPVGWRP